MRRNDMLKKGATGVLVLTLAMSMILTGCGKSDKKTDSNTGNKTETTTAAQEETTEKIEIDGEEVPAQLQDKLNVIEDKNRNYYEIFVGSFYDSDGDGMGDLKGVIEKLDYINDGNPNTDTDMGYNGIWLMPINPSASYHKYDVKDYYGIDSAYGTLDDFKQLIDECHKRNITIIMDLVMNHSAIGHDWFKQARKYLQELPEGQEPNPADCKYVDYYTFVKTDDTLPSNYYPAGSSNYSYLGMFSQQMPDLNLDNPDVRKEFEDITKYWLDMGVDGFRLDAAKEFFSGETPHNVEVLKWFNSYVKSVNPNAYIVAETWASDYDKYLESGIDSAFDFSYSGSDGELSHVVHGKDPVYNGEYFAECLKSSQERVLAANPEGIQACFLGNHDIDRGTAFLAYNENEVKFAQGLLSMMNGSTYIYYGDEIGLGGIGADENKRSPMIWSSTDTKGQTNGPTNMSPANVINKFGSVEEQQKDENSILNYVKQGMKLRNIFPEIARGTIEVIDAGDEEIAAVSKTYNGSKIIILANCDKQNTKTVTLPRSEYGYTCIQGELTVSKNQPYQVEDTIVLPPNAIVILK